MTSLIDETLNYLTSTLPPDGAIYWSGFPDVAQMRELRGAKNISRALDLRRVDQAWISFNRD